MTTEAFTIVPATARRAAFTWEPAELWLVEAGAGYRVNRRRGSAGRRDALIMVRTRGGSGELRLDDGTAFLLDAASLLLVPDAAIRSYRALRTPWAFSWLAAWPAGVPPFAYRELYHSGLQPGEKDAFEAILEELRNPDAAVRDLAGVRTLEWLYRWLAAAERPQPRRDPGIAAALRLAWRSPERGVSIAELAAAAHLTERHFRRRFREVTGVSPKQYLDRLRLEHAAALLRRGGVSVKEAAQHCGFASQFHFSGAFKRYFGVPPSRLYAAVAPDQHQRQQDEE